MSIEAFGCCSHYMMCSEKESCLFPEDEFYTACMYRKNLEAGRIFYGSKKNKKTEIPLPDNKVIINLQNPERTGKISEQTGKVPERFRKNQERIYLDCYDRNFNVGHISGKDLTYQLTEQELEFLKETFTNIGIPFTCKCDENKCVLEGTKEEPANARVTFNIQDNEQKFVIANFNGGCLILKRYADGIAKALKAKGIDAKVNLSGAYDRIVDYKKNVQIKNEVQNLSVTQNTTTNPVRNGNLSQKPAHQEVKQREKGIICGQMSLLDGLAG